MPPAAPPYPLEAAPTASRRASRLLRFIAGSLGVLALLAGLAGAFLFTVIDQRTADLHATLDARLKAGATGRAQALAIWLEGMARLGQRLTRSDLIRLFASEMALTRPDRPPAPWLADQAPYMTQLIGDFVAHHALLGATLLGRDGRIFLASRDAPLPERRSWAERMARLQHASDRIVTPIREIGPPDAARPERTALALDLLLPLPGAQAVEQGEAAGFPAVLVMTVSADAMILDALTRDSESGSLVRLIQPGASGPQQILAAPAPRLAPVEQNLPLAPGEAMAYGSIPTADGGNALAVGVPVPDLPWTVLEQVDAATAFAPLQTYKRSAAAVAAATALGLGLAFSAFWWRQWSAPGEPARRHATADRLENERRDLEAVLDAIPEMIGIKAPEGRYLHVNTAFARALGKSPQGIVGRLDAELFPPEAAGELARVSAQAAAGADVPSLRLAVEVGGERCQLALSITRVESAAAQGGVLLMVRDVGTEPDAQPHERTGPQVAAALARAAGLRDPFLLHQTERMRTHVRAVAERLGLGERELATLDLAASLSQVGRIFMPDWLLAKTGRHTSEEARLVQAHLRHALEVIGTIDFGLPAVEVLAQMHERLDVSGDPARLRGEQVGLPARILDTIEAFCARTSERAEPAPVSPGQALYHLAQKTERYDATVISALAAVVAAGSQGVRARAGGVADRGRAAPQSPAEAAA